MQSIVRFRILAACAADLFSALPAMAQDPYQKPDDSWISISGTVQDVGADIFVLDYGDGLITVEMDDGDRDADGYKLVEGDKVTVNGIVDDDLYETATIEASSVYVESIGTYFFASPLDEEDVTLDTFVTITAPIETSSTVVQGTVTRVDDDEFTLDAGPRELRVEVDDMPYNPLDDKGYQKIEKGDRVSVYGRMDDDLFEGRELEADSVVTLSD